MAVNDSRSMNADFHQGGLDRTFIQLAPDRGNVENPPIERLQWPTYARAETLVDPAFWEAHANRAHLPREIKTTGDGDTRSF